MKLYQAWMTALIQHGLARLFAAEDGYQRRSLRVVLSEVTTEPALTVMKRLHSYTSICSLKELDRARRGKVALWFGSRWKKQSMHFEDVRESTGRFMSGILR